MATSTSTALTGGSGVAFQLDVGGAAQIGYKMTAAGLKQFALAGVSKSTKILSPKPRKSKLIILG